MPHQGYARIPYVRRCLVVWGERRLEAMSCNLSVLGVYVTFPGKLSDDIPEAGEMATLSLPLPEGRVVECDVTVTWQNLEEPQEADSLPPGCGLRFVGMPPDEHDRIEELVRDYRHSAHPESAVPAPFSGFVRMPYVQPCLLVSDTGTWQGVLCNLSLLGAYIAVDPIPPTGEAVRLLFWLPREGKPTEVGTEVAWVNAEEPHRADSLPAGCGLRFVSLPLAVRERVEELVDSYLSVPRDTD